MPFFSAFDGIYDPQNLGNVIRTAACFSLDAIFLPRDNACSVTDTVTNVARGGTEHVKIGRVTNLARYIEELKKRNVFCFGLDEKADKSLYRDGLTGPLCLVLGGEDGLKRLTKERCDMLLKIPASVDFPSLNVACLCHGRIRSDEAAEGEELANALSLHPLATAAALILFAAPARTRVVPAYLFRFPLARLLVASVHEDDGRLRFYRHGRILVARRLDGEELLHRVQVDPVEHLEEKLEAFPLVLPQGVFLAVSPKTDALPQVVEGKEMLFPVRVKGA